MHVRSTVALIFIFSFILMPLSAEAKILRISAPKVELELSPGENYSGEIGVENPDREPMGLSAYTEDWVYAAGGTGEKKFLPAGTDVYSASKWIHFSTPAGILKPFGKEVVRYTVNVPADAKGSYYSVLFFETRLGDAKEMDGSNVLVAGRIGALFFIRIKGTTQQAGEVKSIQIKPPVENQPMEITTTFQNTGNVDITLNGTFLVMDTEGKVLGRGDLVTIYTFPGATETRKSQWIGKLPKGSHELVLTYDLGLGKAIVKEEILIIS